MEPAKVTALLTGPSLVQCHGNAKCFCTIPGYFLDPLNAATQRQRDAIGPGDQVSRQSDRDVDQLARHVCFLTKEIHAVRSDVPGSSAESLWVEGALSTHFDGQGQDEAPATAPLIHQRLVC